MSARDVRYGRRGGAWVDHRPGQLLADLRRLRNRSKAAGTWPDPVDRSQLFHPEAIATSRAHQQRRPGTCASDDTKTKPRPSCDCQPDPDHLAEIWAGRARMAAARQAAGVPLDPLDIEAFTAIRPGGVEEEVG